MNKRSLPKHWAQAMAQSIIARNNTAFFRQSTIVAVDAVDKAAAANQQTGVGVQQPNTDTQQPTVAANAVSNARQSTFAAKEAVSIQSTANTSQLTSGSIPQTTTEQPTVSAFSTAPARHTATTPTAASSQPAAATTQHSLTAPTHTQQPLVCAAGISPSGTVHIGNCREIFTVDFVVRYLQAYGASSQFYLFWDDYDALRKIPEGSSKWMANQLRLPLSVATKLQDSTASFATEHEQQFEQYLPIIGVQPHIKYQHREYEAGVYTTMLHTALANRQEIIAILNENRATPLTAHWWPIVIYSQYTNKDTTDILDWDGEYGITYRCTETDRTSTIDIRTYRKVKLKWRIDWPMRWALYRVAFEPAGKDHHSQGGSFDTAKKMVGRVFGAPPPLSMQYDFISIKGKGGKISSSSGDTISIAEVLEIYQPEVVRYLFASTRANAEFAISFDVDVIKIYEDYDKCELIAHGLTDASEKRIHKERGIYWLSQIESNALFGANQQSEYFAIDDADSAQPAAVPSTAHISPLAIDEVKKVHAPAVDNSDAARKTAANRSIPQISFRHLCTMVQIYDGNIDSALAHCPAFHDMSTQRQQQYRTRAQCAQTWIQTYAPDRFKFTLKQPGDVSIRLTDTEQELLKQLVVALNRHDSHLGEVDGIDRSDDIAINAASPTGNSNNTTGASATSSSRPPTPTPDTDIDTDPSTALHNALYDLAKQLNIEFKQICQLCYQLLIGRDDGPRLASFMLLLGIPHCQKIFTHYANH